MTTDAIGSPSSDRIGEPDPRLLGLVERLRHARSRSAAGLATNAAIASVLFGLAVFVGFQLAFGLLGGLAPGLAFSQLSAPDWLAALGSEPIPQHTLIALGAAILAVPVALGMALSKNPQILAVARAADRKFQTSESMSTALEVANAPGGPSGVVAQALMDIAGAQADTVDPKRLVPVQAPRLALGLPVMLGLAVLVATLPPPPLLEQALDAIGAANFEPEFDGGQRLQTAEDLRRIAAILQQDATQRANPELQAIARQLDFLAMELADNPDLPKQPVIEEMERLVEAAGEIYGGAGELPGTPRDLSRLLEFALDRMDPDAQNLVPRNFDGEVGAPAPEAGEAEAREEAVENAFEAVALNTPEPEENKAQNPMPGMTINPRQLGEGDEGDMPADLNEAPDAFTEIYGELGVDDRRFERGGAELIGLAGGGEAGDFAGVGEGDLFGPIGERDPIDVAWEMFLEAEIREGRGIRIDLPPIAELREAGGEAPEGAARWEAQAEKEVTRIRLPALDREAVSRYFRALLVGRNQ